MDINNDVAQPNSDAALTPESLAATGEPETTKEQPKETPKEPPKEPAKPEELATELAKEIEYTDFTLPDGFTKDDEAFGAFIPWAKENKLSQEQAQKALDMHSALMQKTVSQIIQQRETNYTEVMAQVKAESGEKFAESVGKVNALFKQMGADPVTFHQAVAQVAGYDSAKAKEMYGAIAKIAQQAFFSGDFFRANATTKEPERYPNLPGRNR